MIAYSDAMNDALDRLQGLGFEYGPQFAVHAPMAAEALATLGYTDILPTWVEHNKATRQYGDLPEPNTTIHAADEADWRSALGDFGRVGDWNALFLRELADQPWDAVLARWCPRLLPGASAALTHGVIRTSHAVRGLSVSPDPTSLQIAELAHGLGSWAARFTPVPASPERIGGAGGATLSVETAFDRLITHAATTFTERTWRYPVPLIHSITCPAAIRFLLPHLPSDQHRASFDVARRLSASITMRFGGSGNDRPVESWHSDEELPDPTSLVEAAVEVGDEHVIKLAEVAVRSPRPEPSLVRAAMVVTDQLSRRPSGLTETY